MIGQQKNTFFHLTTSISTVHCFVVVCLTLAIDWLLQNWTNVLITYQLFTTLLQLTLWYFELH